MKNVVLVIALVFLVTSGYAPAVCASEGKSPTAVGALRTGGSQPFGADLDIDYCYTYLTPFGTWVTLEPWGYVWFPRHMGYRWRPYTDGHWVWTDYGWTWLSDVEWGWIPFHYGRWGWDDDLGWFWVPGTAWGPAWVTWRASDLYMGWAPIPPGIEFRAGMDFGALSLRIPGRFWIFIGASHFLDREIYPSVLPYERNATIVTSTVIHSNFSFRGTSFINGGVAIDTIQRVTRQNVPAYRLQDARQPGPPHIAGNQIEIYRPSFKGNPAARPRTVLSRDQGRQELAPARVFEPRPQAPKTATASDVQRRQTEERKLLQQSQAQELKAIDQQRSQEQKKVQIASEKAKIQQDYEAKKSEVAKQHEAEKQQLNERHKTDTEQIRRAGREKPPEKPPKQP